MWYDLVTVGILGFTTWRGAGRGFVWQLATIAAIVLSFCCAAPISAVIAPATGLKPPIDRWAALLGSYVALSFACFAVARYLKGVIEKIKLEEYDRHLGAIFGFLKGAVFCLVLTFFAVTLVPASHGFIFGSYSGYASAMIVDELRPVVPEAYHDTLDRSLRTLAEARAATGPDGDTPIDVPDGIGLGGDTEPGEQGGREPLDPILELLQRLPADVTDADRDWLRRMVESIDDESRTELLSRLAGAPPRDVLDSVRGWFGEREAAADGARRREALLNGIADVYTPHPAARRSIVDEVAGLLAALPLGVQLAVLEDWHADLLGATVGEDPNPRTTIATPLDERIRSGLESAGATNPATDSARREGPNWWPR